MPRSRKSAAVTRFIANAEFAPKVDLRLKITVRCLLAPTETPVAVYEVKTETSKASWTDNYGTKELLAAYLRGMKAMCSMLGFAGSFHVEIPDPPEW